MAVYVVDTRNHIFSLRDSQLLFTTVNGAGKHANLLREASIRCLKVPNTGGADEAKTGAAPVDWDAAEVWWDLGEEVAATAAYAGVAHYLVGVATAATAATAQGATLAVLGSAVAPAITAMLAAAVISAAAYAAGAAAAASCAYATRAWSGRGGDKGALSANMKRWGRLASASASLSSGASSFEKQAKNFVALTAVGYAGGVPGWNPLAPDQYASAYRNLVERSRREAELRAPLVRLVASVRGAYLRQAPRAFAGAVGELNPDRFPVNLNAATAPARLLGAALVDTPWNPSILQSPLEGTGNAWSAAVTASVSDLLSRLAFAALGFRADGTLVENLKFPAHEAQYDLNKTNDDGMLIGLLGMYGWKKAKPASALKPLAASLKTFEAKFVRREGLHGLAIDTFYAYTAWVLAPLCVAVQLATQIAQGLSGGIPVLREHTDSAPTRQALHDLGAHTADVAQALIAALDASALKLAETDSKKGGDLYHSFVENGVGTLPPATNEESIAKGAPGARAIEGCASALLEVAETMRDGEAAPAEMLDSLREKVESLTTKSKEAETAMSEVYKLSRKFRNACGLAARGDYLRTSLGGLAKLLSLDELAALPGGGENDPTMP